MKLKQADTLALKSLINVKEINISTYNLYSSL